MPWLTNGSLFMVGWIILLLALIEGILRQMGSSLKVFKTISIEQHFLKRKRSVEAAIIFGEGFFCQKHNYYWREFVFIQLICSVNCLSKFFVNQGISSRCTAPYAEDNILTNSAVNENEEYKVNP